LNNSYRSIAFFCLSILLLFLLAGCAQPAQSASISEPGSVIQGATVDETRPGSQSCLEIRADHPGEKISLDFQGLLISGDLSLEIVNAIGKTIWRQPVSESGQFRLEEVVAMPQPGSYDLRLAWDGSVEASYSLRWAYSQQPESKVAPTALVGGIGMILVALGFVIYALLRRLGGRFLLLGGLGWIITVALKFGWAILFNGPLYRLLTGALTQAPGEVVFSLYVGALTGIFEVGLLWLALRYTRLGQASWKQALAFGIGFGALEALLLGFSSLATVLTGLLAPQTLPAAALEALARQSGLAWSIAPAWERFFTIFVHIFSCLLVFYAVRVGQVKWMWLAFVYKTLLDTAAAYAQIKGIQTVAQVWTIEAIVGILGLLGWIGIRWLKPRYPDLAQETAEAPVSLEVPLESGS
jgi:uncharacterized membrane protein YhfC